jgi:uncharacterized protein (DUF4415 family)
MNERKHASRRSLKSDLARVDAHLVTPDEYKELPELTDEMLARAKINKGGRPLSLNPRRLISLRLPADVIERWRATGPGWQTRMAERLSRLQPLPIPTQDVVPLRVVRRMYGDRRSAATIHGAALRSLTDVSGIDSAPLHGRSSRIPDAVTGAAPGSQSHIPADAPRRPW